MHQKIKYYWLIGAFLLPIYAEASHHCSQWLAKVISIQGQSDSQHPGETVWRAISPDQTFCHGDKIRTKKHSRVTLLFSNQSRATLDQSSTLILMAPKQKRSSWYIDLLQGSTFFRSRQPQRLNIQTPFINAVHEGTEFLVKVTSNKTEITVFDGQVAATNKHGSINIKKSFTGIALKDIPPQLKPLIIQPQDAVQWTLYYPPILDYQTFSASPAPELQPAIIAYKQGNSYQSLSLLDKIPIAQQNIHYQTLKAALLLTAGSIDASTKLIKEILLYDKNNSTAFALKSIIAVTKNRQNSALSLAKTAINNNPQSSVAHIALSYAQQATFNIEQALSATQEAIKLSPKNALAWARLSELQLSLGKRNDALISAKKAQSLNPNLARTQTVLGFNYLAKIDIDQAKKAFKHAIHLNSADPLAYLGLGLAYIRKGAVEAGKDLIETAVSLAPDNAIMRSYLGKAYYELNNDEFASTEFEIAKEMDPNDPTPWFYSAIHKQTTNRPIEALQDIQKAIELNDNRGVYRSKLLLDEDAAAKSANMARIYQDLDYNRVALKQAWTSLAQDHSNPSAHRFLSDTLQGKPRQRIARASELLQAQLFQPINTIPVQPQLTSENNGILNSTGPGSLSSNEYDPLFTSNGAHILLNGAVGSNNTLTDSAIISGVYDQFSLSFGQFHFQTDGFRTNDDYKQNIYNAFAQMAVTPNLNLQVEFKREDITAGDTPQRLNNFSKNKFRQTLDKDSARFGLLYKIAPEHDLIFSAIATDLNDKSIDFADDFSIVTLSPLISIETTKKNTEEINFKESGYQFEGQYLFHPNTFKIITGLGYLNLNGTRDRILTEETIDNLIRLPPFPPGFSTTNPPKITASQNNLETDYFNSYIYSKFEISKTVSMTLGLSYDVYDDSLVKKNQLNPKVGLIWQPTENLLFRSAIFRNLKRPFAGNQTIEPTEISGFNQFFDENDGASTWHYGVGADYQPLNNLFIGGEASWRNTSQPEISTNNTVRYTKRDEYAYLAYLYWHPTNFMSFSSEYQINKFNREIEHNIVDNENAKSLKTHQLLLSINFYHPSGVFSKFSSTNIDQSANFTSNSSNIMQFKDHFWVFDTSLGFRLPNKLGSIQVEANNIFNNNNIRYHSEWNSSGPLLTNFVPEREIILKLNLNY